MKRKVFLILTILILVFSLISCKKKTEETYSQQSVVIGNAVSKEVADQKQKTMQWILKLRVQAQLLSLLKIWKHQRKTTVNTRY